MQISNQKVPTLTTQYVNISFFSISLQTANLDIQNEVLEGHRPTAFIYLLFYLTLFTLLLVTSFVMKKSQLQLLVQTYFNALLNSC